MDAADELHGVGEQLAGHGAVVTQVQSQVASDVCLEPVAQPDRAVLGVRHGYFLTIRVEARFTASIIAE